MIRANYAVPHSNLIYYFEVTVENLGKNSAIGIGLAVTGSITDCMPGWRPCTFGYHGDDGKRFRLEETSGSGDEYGPTWKVNDVVGCGWNHATGEIFLTYNGRNLGPAFKGVKPRHPLLAEDASTGVKASPWGALGLHAPYSETNGNADGTNDGDEKEKPAGGIIDALSEGIYPRYIPGVTVHLELYPVLGFHSPGARMKVNFGDQRFKYDIHGQAKNVAGGDGRPQPPLCRFAAKGTNCALAKTSREHLFQFRHDCPAKKDCPLLGIDPSHVLLWNHEPTPSPPPALAAPGLAAQGVVPVAAPVGGVTVGSDYKRDEGL